MKEIKTNLEALTNCHEFSSFCFKISSSQNNCLFEKQYQTPDTIRYPETPKSVTYTTSWDVHLLDETFLIVFNILLLSVSGYQMKHSFSCLIYYFSVFGYQMEDSFPCLIYHLLLDVWISDETLLLVFNILLLARAKILPRSRRDLAEI